MNQATKRERSKIMFAVGAILAAATFAATTVVAQGYGPSGERGGYGGQGYGMMGGGMMGGGWGAGAQSGQQLTLSQANRLLDQTARSAKVDKAKNEVTFTAHAPSIAIAAVQPGYPDTTFEVAGMVDPTIVVSAGATVTLTFINMDYGPSMDHGIILTANPPPYSYFAMAGMSESFAGIPVLPPRDAASDKTAHYPTDSVTFTAPPRGTYYYLCQYEDHASKGMYGRFIVAGN